MVSGRQSGANSGEVIMSTKNNGYQAVSIYGATMAGTIKVNMGVKGRRPLSFPNLAAARAFVEAFDVDSLTVRIGARLPALTHAPR